MRNKEEMEVKKITLGPGPKSNLILMPVIKDIVIDGKIAS